MAKKSLCAAAFAAGLMSSAPAAAVVLNFSLTGDYTAFWQLDSEQIPLDAAEGFGIIYGDVKGVYAAPLSDIAEVCFFNADLGGGIQINTVGTFDGVVSTAGPQVYSGSEVNPTFLTGTFKFIGYDVVNEIEDSSRSYTLTVRNAVPEPATWATLVAGFGVVGAIGRCNRRRSPRVFTA